METSELKASKLIEQLSPEEEENAFYLANTLITKIFDALVECGFDEESALIYAQSFIEAGYDQDVMCDLAIEFTAIKNSKKN